MTTTENAQVTEAIHALYLAALKLNEAWSLAEETTDVALTETYPIDALPLSFDEIAFAIGQWEADFAKKSSE